MRSIESNGIWLALHNFGFVLTHTEKMSQLWRIHPPLPDYPKPEGEFSIDRFRINDQPIFTEADRITVKKKVTYGSSFGDAKFTVDEVVDEYFERTLPGQDADAILSYQPGSSGVVIALKSRQSSDRLGFTWKPHEVNPSSRMSAGELIFTRAEEFKVETSLYNGYLYRDDRRLSKAEKAFIKNQMQTLAKTHIIANVAKNVIKINLIDGSEPVVVKYSNE